MRNDNDYLALSDKMALTNRSRLSADVTYLMLRGAGYAAVAVLLIWLVIAVIAGIGRALPPESQEAADPTPWTQFQMPPAEDGS